MRSLMLLASVALLSACKEADVPETIDSAVTWSLAPTPRLSIGVIDGDDRTTFRRIVGAYLMRDGGVLVADVQPSLTIFDSTGAFVRRFGRKGNGPGEFAYIFSSPFAYRGDSIAVWDLGMQRVTVFDAAGVFGRSTIVTSVRQFRPAGTTPDQSCCGMHRALANGHFVLEYPATIPIAPGPNRYSTATLASIAPDGSVSDSIGGFASRMYRYDATSRSGHRLLHMTPFFVFAVVGDTVFGGNGADPWFFRQNPGSLPDTIRLPETRVPVTAAVKDLYANGWREEFKRHPEHFEGPASEMYEGEYATHVPMYTRLIYDGGGGLWFEQWAHPNSTDSARFHIYTTRGQPIARIAIPGTSRIADIRRNRVSMIETDSLGVEYVRVYDIIGKRPD